MIASCHMFIFEIHKTLNLRIINTESKEATLLRPSQTEKNSYFLVKSD